MNTIDAIVGCKQVPQLVLSGFVVNIFNKNVLDLFVLGCGIECDLKFGRDAAGSPGRWAADTHLI